MRGVRADDHGGAIIGFGESLVRFDGATWGEPRTVTYGDFYLDPDVAHVLRGNGDGFVFGICGKDPFDTSDYILGQPCITPFDATGEITLIGEDLGGFATSMSRGSALNDAGQGIATWVAPLDIGNPSSDYSLWAVMR